MKKMTTALAAASLLIGATVWAADDSSTQSGATTQSGQPGQSTQTGQYGSQAGQSIQSSGQSSLDAAQTTAGQAGEPMSETARAEFQKISQDPQEFIQHAYQNNLTEIQLGQLAQQKGQSQEVKQFGQHLIQGHQALNDKITQLASQKNIQLSKQLDARHQKMVDRLQALSGADFDKRFMREQVMSHRRDVALYQRASQNNTDSDVKSFAQTSLPALREHLQMAQQQAGPINEAAGAGQDQGQSGTTDQYQSQGHQGKQAEDLQKHQEQQQGQDQQQPQQPQQ